MNVIHRNVMIPIEALKPHPDNPRKDVGDITELAESIKANGVFQNLTVLKGDILDGYTVIIGHRRLAAARAAGLTELPCMVVEMDEREQISTMLLENMQRNDLTVYEQAQGFQMMLDLGETESDIAEKTGFSKTTIKHRLKLLELDPEEFRKSQERQPSMADYIELEKISDEKLRNQVLKDIGTNNFKWKLESALREEKQKKAHDEWNKFLKELKLKKDKESEVNKKERIGTGHYYSDALTKKVKDEITKAVKNGKAKSYAIQYGWVYILGEGKAKSKKTQDPKEQALKAHIRRIEKLEQQAAEMREAFVKNYYCGKEELIIDAFICAQASVYVHQNDKFAGLLGLKAEDISLEEGSEYRRLIAKRPEKVLLALMAYDIEHTAKWRLTLHDDFSGKHRSSETLDNWYCLLCKLGYKMSTNEQQLLDGSHECFKEEAEDENTATE